VVCDTTWEFKLRNDKRFTLPKKAAGLVHYSPLDSAREVSLNLTGGG